eukprot:SM000360S13676  [mRNA]  locus=s360:20430:29808:- [translate_table: standard]
MAAARAGPPQPGGGGSGGGGGGSGVGRQRHALSFSKQPFHEDVGPRKIKSIHFGTQSAQEVVKGAEFHVYERNLYQMPQRQPLANGILDKRLVLSRTTLLESRWGTSDKRGECATCHGKLTDCPGHFGYIRLALPVYHIGYFKNVISIMQCICKTCSRLLLPEVERRQFLRRSRNPRIEVLQRRVLLKKVIDRCKRTRFCHHCGDANGVVKKAGSTLKIIHDKYQKNYELKERVISQFAEAGTYNKDLQAHVHHVQDDLNPVRVLGLLERMTEEDCEILDLHQRPEHLILTHLPVPPVAIRPSVEMESAAGSNEDDITMKLMQIIEVNSILRQGLERGLIMLNLMENWDFLQLQVAMYINSELPGLPQVPPVGKPLRGFVQRLKGKQGRFRGNLSGKRVDFSGRTVISPDPNLKIDEVAVPIQMAQNLTYPEMVSRYNIEKLRQRVANGMSKHPGANFVVFPDGGKWFLKYGDRRRVAAELKYGDIVERHLEDGDIVLFNRQPSLHKMSIMSHRVKVMPWRTLRFNESVCNPYNADFDGDEMNLHVPQTEEARSEALQLMGVHTNLCTPKNGEILIAATQDFLTSSFLITCKDNFYDRATFGLFCSYMGDALDPVDLPTPAVIKPIELWTGKQLFSVLVRPSAQVRIFVTLSLAERNYSKEGESLCVNDGYVLFRNSELLCGQLGKATLGAGNKNGLFSTLFRDYSAEAAAACMNRLAKLSARWIGNHGFSIGIDDVSPGARLALEKEKKIRKGYNACTEHIEAFNAGQLALQPGCNAAQTLEAEITGELNKIREEAGKVCLRELHWRNSPLVMSQCGSKGSAINISQMIACVGQQSVGGHRAPDGFLERSLPHFPRKDKTPQADIILFWSMATKDRSLSHMMKDALVVIWFQAKGFVANSFYSGMMPTEFFFHTRGGREGLVDTAVKTAETGYMSRRLMKALEDLSTQYDGTVRNSSGGIVQLVYGDDGMDPVDMEGAEGTPLNLQRMMTKVKATCPFDPAAAPSPAQLSQQLDAKLTQNKALLEGGCSTAFQGLVLSFCKKEIETVAQTHERLHLQSDADDHEVDLVAKEVAANISGISLRQLEVFLDLCMSRYQGKRIEAGSAVGAVGAQSIGEPGTQMTLKTFHFAGVASMNITLGVPRIKEIINASKNISTPIITVKLLSDMDVKAARLVKGRIEKTTLGEVAQHIKMILQPGQAYLSVKLDVQRIASLQLDITATSVAQSIMSTPKLKIKQQASIHTSFQGQSICLMHIRVNNFKDRLMVFSPEADRTKLYFSLHFLRNALPRVIVKGIPTVERAVINDLSNGRYNLLVEGTNLAAVMGTEGVDYQETASNHIMEAEHTLGIEAARTSIMNEIQYTMASHGMSIDARHTMLLADVMTYKGEVLGITRFGIAKMKDSVLMLASFEKTTDHLFDAAIHGRVDQIEGVSECIIMGIPMPIGTGLFKIRQR